MVYYLTPLSCAQLGVSGATHSSWRSPSAREQIHHPIRKPGSGEGSAKKKAAAPRRPCAHGPLRPRAHMPPSLAVLKHAHGRVPCPQDPRVHGPHGPRAHGLMRQVSGYPVRTGSTYPVHTGPPECCSGLCPCNPHFAPAYPFIPWTYIYSFISSI